MSVRKFVAIAVATGVAVFSGPGAQADANAHAHKRTSSWPSVSILLYGDSITQGQAAHATWRYRLWQGLQSGGNDVHFVGPVTTVWNAYTAGSTEYRFPNFDQNSAALAGMKFMTPAWTVSSLAASYHPNVIVGLIGINDLLNGTSPKTLVANWRAQIDATREVDSNASFVLVQYGQAWWPGVTEYNSLLSTLAADMDHSHSRVVVATAPTLDMWTDTHDGLHLTSSGEWKQAQAVEGALAQIGLTSGTPTTDPTDVGAWAPTPALTATPTSLTVSWQAEDYASSEDVYVEDDTTGSTTVARFQTGTSTTIASSPGHTYKVWVAPDYFWAPIGTSSAPVSLTTPTP